MPVRFSYSSIFSFNHNCIHVIHFFINKIDGLLGSSDVAGLDDLLIGSDGQPPLLAMTTLKDGTVAMVARRREDGRPPDLPEGYTLVPGENGQLIVRKKRQRNLQKLGIGGFQVRRPWARVRDKEEDNSSQQLDDASTASSEKRKPQQRRNNKAKSSKLVETYPSYLQEAFFGRELLTTPTPVPSKSDSLPGLETNMKTAGGGSDSDDPGDVIFNDDAPIHHRAAKDPSVVIQLSKEEVAELMERSQRSSSSVGHIKSEPQQRPSSSASSITARSKSASGSAVPATKFDLKTNQIDDFDDMEEDEAAVLKDMFPLAGCDLLDSADDLVDSIMKEGDAGQDDDDVVDDSDLMDDNSNNPLDEPSKMSGRGGAGKNMIRMSSNLSKTDIDEDDDDLMTDEMLMTMRMSGMSEQTMASLDTMVATAARAGPNASVADNLEDALTAAGLPNMDCNDVDDIFKDVLDTSVAVDSSVSGGSFIGSGASGVVASVAGLNHMPVQQQQPPMRINSNAQLPGGVQHQPMMQGVVAQQQGIGGNFVAMNQQQSQVPPPPASGAVAHRALSSLSGGISQGTISPSQNSSAMQQQPQQHPPPCSPYFSEYSSSPGFSPAFSEPPASPWPNSSSSSNPGANVLGAGASADLMDMDSASGSAAATANQRNALKWEADEALGLSATISAVLYANTNHPELKRDFPAWNERWKQIAKIWRSLAAERKAPFLQKARENRATVRLHKSQQSTSGMHQQQVRPKFNQIFCLLVIFCTWWRRILYLLEKKCN